MHHVVDINVTRAQQAHEEVAFAREIVLGDFVVRHQLADDDVLLEVVEMDGAATRQHGDELIGAAVVGLGDEIDVFERLYVLGEGDELE